jgi:hypothetical protein
MRTVHLKELLEDLLYTGASLEDQFLLEAYTLIGENVNLEDYYGYNSLGKSLWTFVDKEGFKHVLKLNYNPGVPDKELTVKLFWDKDGKPSYDKPPATDHKVFSTYLRILVEEILPKLSYFLGYFKVDKLTLDATDYVSYRLYSIALSGLLDKSKFELVKAPDINTLYIKKT